jgi:predicted secreted hydrolase
VRTNDTSQGDTRLLFFKINRLFTLWVITLWLMLGNSGVWAISQNKKFESALPGYHYQFPQDHGAHPRYKTEWWYYTGHLKTGSGKTFGYQLTFFRSATDRTYPLARPTAWELSSFYPAHFAVSDISNQKFYFQERLNRGNLQLAGAETKVYSVWNENWSAKQVGKGFLLEASSPEYLLHLNLESVKPPVIHGEGGISQKGACVGCASHYYSLTRLKTEGVLTLHGVSTPVTGVSWMDHEFGSNQLEAQQVGWDWFSLQLDNNTELMLYVMRLKNGQWDPHSSGTWVDAMGNSKHLTVKDFKITSTGKWKSPTTGGTYPMGWHLEIPGEKIDLNVTPSFEAQELKAVKSTRVTYWEGASTVKGWVQGKPVNGQGYVEMTGYAQAFRQKI